MSYTGRQINFILPPTFVKPAAPGFYNKAWGEGKTKKEAMNRSAALVSTFSIAMAMVQALAGGMPIRPHYDIKVRLDTENHVLLGEESISFKNDSGGALDICLEHLCPGEGDGRL